MTELILTKLLYRPDEVADLLSMSESKVYELVKEGLLIAHCEKGAGKKPLKIIAESIIKYKEKYVINPKEWRK